MKLKINETEKGYELDVNTGIIFHENGTLTNNGVLMKEDPSYPSFFIDDFQLVSSDLVLTIENQKSGNETFFIRNGDLFKLTKETGIVCRFINS